MTISASSMTVHEAGGAYFPALAWDGPKADRSGEIPPHRKARADARHSLSEHVDAAAAARARHPARTIAGAWRPRRVRHQAHELHAGCRWRHGVAAACRRAAETLRARYLAGCDGARGVVRAGIGVEFASETIDPHPMITADVVVEGLGAHPLAYVGQRQGRRALARAAGADQCVPALRQVRGRGAGSFVRGLARACARPHWPSGVEPDRGAVRLALRLARRSRQRASAPAARSSLATPLTCIRRPAGRA